jgi:hypothetical protein
VYARAGAQGLLRAAFRDTRASDGGGLMGALEEISQEFGKFMLTLGVIGTFVALFYLWAKFGTIGIVMVLIILSLGLGGYYAWQKGMF